MQGGSDKNKPMRGWPGQDYLGNNIKNFNYLNISARSQGCIELVCITHCAGERVMVIGEVPVLHGICVRNPYTNTKSSNNTAYTPLP